MIKLIGIDLDGTLLTDEKLLPPDFWVVANELLQRDIAILIASGRPFHNVASVFEDLKHELYFACDNGTYVVHQGKELLVNPLPPDSVQQFIDAARELDRVYPVLCGKDMAFIENDDPEFMRQALKYYQDYKILDDLTKVDDLVLKISLCDLDDAEKNSYPSFKKFEEDYSIAISGRIWLDITAQNGNKGTALQAIQKRLGISRDETLVFGDYLNDLGLIQNAHYSYAMKNAHPGLKEAASFITASDNNRYGVMEVIRDLMSIEP